MLQHIYVRVVRLGHGRQRVIRKKYTATFVLAAAITAAPVLAVIAVQMLTIKPDLRSARLERNQRPAEAVLLTWQSLEESGSGADTISRTAKQACGKRVRVLGYMMDFVRPIRNGELVRDFLIAPECGALLHPAPFVLDQTIEIHLREDCRTLFQRRKAVWVTGTFDIQGSTSAQDRPLYRLDDACLARIQDEELHRLTTP